MTADQLTAEVANAFHSTASTFQCSYCAEPVERTDSGGWWRHVDSLTGPCGYRLMDSLSDSD